MSEQLPKQYNPGKHENEIYQIWEESGFFNPDNLTDADKRYESAEPFSIAMPPPNVTGNLHVGHSMFLTLQDIMIRRARMQGKKTLWLPGTDHAAIATNFVVERKLWEEQKKTRHDIGREKFLELVDEWINETKGNIQNQIRKMGASCDWSREKYTLSEELSVAVRTMFKQMYEAGLIYQGGRIVNWCPRCDTTLSNDEVEYQQKQDPIYYIKYPLKGKDQHITVATVRPETMLGDTAVAVHPSDKRYKQLIGQTVMLPLVNREIPIVADEAVDPEFGSGAVKVTPGHSETDFEISQRNDIEVISFINRDGQIDEKAALDYGFEGYAGLDIKKAREKVAKDLETSEFLEKQEQIEHNVGYCYRCDTVVENLVSKQWFINVNHKFQITNSKFIKQLKLKEDKASLKEVAIAAVKSGAIKIVPERFEKNYLNWMENLYDWNISRQIWFGHQVPVWYKKRGKNADLTQKSAEGEEKEKDDRPVDLSSDSSPAPGEENAGAGGIYVGVQPPEGDGWVQDTDTLDTWFSSSLWTFSTLGWPLDQSEHGSGKVSASDLDLYHPTTVMETGYDILTFWVNRMILMTSFAMQEIPFETVYLHGLILDEKGDKMSKSKGNVLDPLEMTEKYGTDALRLSLIIGSTPGQDMKISESKIATYRNFANKLWNISRFVLTNLEESRVKSQELSVEPKSLADEWILERLEQTITEVNNLLDKHQYGLAGEKLENFTWNEFADWYIEITKVSDKRSATSNKQEILYYVLENILRLWHPFIPFVTEHIWSFLNDSLLMIQKYPETSNQRQAISNESIEQFEKLQELVTGIRNLKAEYKIPPSKKFAVYADEIESRHEWVKDQADIINHLARVRINFDNVEDTKQMPYFIWEGIKIFLIIPDFDPEKEIKRAKKQLAEHEQTMNKLQGQLKNKQFKKQAPEKVVEKLQAEFDEAKQQSEKLKAKIKALK